MGHDNNVVKLMNLLVKFQKSPSFWLCLPSQANRPSHESKRTIRLVKSDGSLEIYERPVAVSELMKDFPKHMVCRSDSFYIGQMTPALSETDRLRPGQSYFLLPSQFFQNVLSFVTIAALNPENSGALARRGSASRQPFHIQKGPTGCLRIRVSEDFISELIMERRKNSQEEEETESPCGRVCTTAQLKKDYVQLVCPRRWKPKLETIRETKSTARTRTVRIGRRSAKESRHPFKSHHNQSHEQKSNSRAQSKSKFKYCRIRKSTDHK